MLNELLTQSTVENFFAKQNSIINASRALGDKPRTDVENVSLEIWKARRYTIEKDIVENELTLWEGYFGPIENWELTIYPVVGDNWNSNSVRYFAYINTDDVDRSDVVEDVVVYKGKAVNTHKYFTDYTYFQNPQFESEEDYIEDNELTLNMDKLLQYIKETGSKEKGIDKYAEMEVLQSVNWEAYYSLVEKGAA